MNDNWKRIKLSDERRVNDGISKPSMKLERLKEELLNREQDFMEKYFYIIKDTMNSILDEREAKRKKNWVWSMIWAGGLILASSVGFLTWYYWNFILSISLAVGY